MQNSLNATMDPAKDMPGESTCTTCQFTEDTSNYWTAVLFFRARNGTFKRVPIRPNVGFDDAEGGMTVYYMQNGGFRDSVCLSATRWLEPSMRPTVSVFTSCLSTLLVSFELKRSRAMHRTSKLPS